MKLLQVVLFASLLVSPPCTSALGHKKKTSSLPPSSANYVGSDTCIACHDDSEKPLEATAHRKLLADKDAANHGCESCHGPGSDHVNGNGDTSKIFSFRAAAAAEATSRCGTCHSTLGEEHKHQKVNCVSCHSVHHAAEAKAILVKSPPQLCLDCHR